MLDYGKAVSSFSDHMNKSLFELNVVLKVAALKEFLKSNKIYFETAVAALLSMMAITISGAQVWIASQQTKVASAQLEVARQEIAPIIHLSTEYIRDFTSAEIESENIVIGNVGAPAMEAKVRHIVFLVVELSSSTQPLKVFNAEVALPDYYGGTVVHQYAKGPMFTIQGFNNVKKFAGILEGFKALAVEEGYYSDVSLERYVNISYVDILGNDYDLFYSYDTVHGGTLMSETLGEERFIRHRSLFGGDYYSNFGSITPNDLFDVLINDNNQTQLNVRYLD